MEKFDLMHPKGDLPGDQLHVSAPTEAHSWIAGGLAALAAGVAIYGGGLLAPRTEASTFVDVDRKGKVVEPLLPKQLNGPVIDQFTLKVQLRRAM